MTMCLCKGLPELADVGMGQHEKVFSTFQTEIRHGDPFWWLSAIQCRACQQWWLVAADERINDVFIMRRLTRADVSAIIDQRLWPQDFSRFSDVLRLGCERGHNWTFGDPESPALVETVGDLAREDSSLDLGRIAYLLNIDLHQAARLVDLAEAQEQVSIVRS